MKIFQAILSLTWFGTEYEVISIHEFNITIVNCYCQGLQLLSLPLHGHVNTIINAVSE